MKLIAAGMKEIAEISHEIADVGGYQGVRLRGKVKKSTYVRLPSRTPKDFVELPDSVAKQIADWAHIPSEQAAAFRTDLGTLMVNLWARSYLAPLDALEDAQIARGLEAVHAAALQLLSALTNLPESAANRLSCYWFGQMAFGPAHNLEELRDIEIYLKPRMHDGRVLCALLDAVEHIAKSTSSEAELGKSDGRPPQKPGSFDCFVSELVLAIIDRKGRTGSSRNNPSSSLVSILRLILPHAVRDDRTNVDVDPESW